MPAQVSVIIPAYNRAREVKNAIQSALQQTIPVEIVVVDDGSADATVDAVRQFNAAGVRLVQQANAGVAAARNHGAAQATTPYLLFLDSDDTLMPHAAERLLSEFKAHPELVLAFSQARYVDQDGVLLSLYKPPFPRPAGVWSSVRELEHLLLDNYVTMGSALIHHKSWETIGGFDVACGNNAEDWDFWERIVELGESTYIAEPLTNHCMQMGSLSHIYTKAMRERTMQNYRRMLDRVYMSPQLRAHFLPLKPRLEAFWYYHSARLAYAIHDIPTARHHLQAAQKFDPNILADPEAPEIKSLWFKLKLPHKLIETLRQYKNRNQG